MNFMHVLKGKLLVALIAGVALIGGATAVFAANAAGQGVVHSITHTWSSTATTPDVASHKNNSHDTTSHKNECSGLPEAQQLASTFSLSIASKSDAIQAICALHQGTFKGTTSSGASVSSNRVFGYGEIAMLLTYAQYLATHDKANASSKLTSDNVRGYLVQALQSCDTTPLETCLKTNIPGFQSGNSNGNRQSNGNPGSHGNGNGHGKPARTPTPPPHH